MSNLASLFRIGNNPVMPTGEEDLMGKSMNPEIDMEKSERVQDSKSIIEDPLSMVDSMGYKDKPYSLTYETLKKMTVRNSVVASVIQTRVNQISTFTQPARYTKDGIGYEIKLRDPKAQPSDEDKEIMLALESFIENCGFSYDPARDNFDTLVRKLLRDSLTYDQMTFEIVPDRMGRPAEIYAVDASTVRAASIEPEEGEDYVTPTDFYTSRGDTRWVQVLNEEVIAEFSGSELAFAIRNPRTDIDVQPYGFSELEILIHQITSHLWAEEYNSRYFSQGGTTKGVLNLKGQNISRPQLDAFRRQWTAQLAGMTGAWKTPVVSVEGLEYINVSQSNREMEYEMWMNYLINIVCAVYQIDPAEINFPNRGGAGGSAGGGLGDGGIEDRLKNSRDKGLRPLLRFLESTINRNLIRRFSSKYTFNFVGLDGETETERLEVSTKQVKSFRTINEVRADHDLNPIEDGDIILDPTYTNYLLQKQQAEQMEQQGGEQPEEEDTEQMSPDEQQEQEEQEQMSDSIDDKYNQ